MSDDLDDVKQAISNLITSVVLGDGKQFQFEEELLTAIRISIDSAYDEGKEEGSESYWDGLYEGEERGYADGWDSGYSAGVESCQD